jgi:hypothetical protein
MSVQSTPLFLTVLAKTFDSCYPNLESFFIREGLLIFDCFLKSQRINNTETNRTFYNEYVSYILF